MVTSCKFYMDGQRMRVYMLSVYIIHVERDDIILSHHMWLYVACDFIYVGNKILVVHVGCNLCLVAFTIANWIIVSQFIMQNYCMHYN
jgi:hypothetical protein